MSPRQSCWRESIGGRGPPARAASASASGTLPTGAATSAANAASSYPGALRQLGAEELGVHRGGLLGDVAPVEAAQVLVGFGDEAAAELVVGEDADRHFGERFGVMGAETQAGLLVRDHLAQAAGVGDDA